MSAFAIQNIKRLNTGEPTVRTVIGVTVDQAFVLLKGRLWKVGIRERNTNVCVGKRELNNE